MMMMMVMMNEEWIMMSNEWRMMRILTGQSQIFSMMYGVSLPGVLDTRGQVLSRLYCSATPLCRSPLISLSLRRCSSSTMLPVAPRPKCRRAFLLRCRVGSKVKAVFKDHGAFSSDFDDMVVYGNLFYCDCPAFLERFKPSGRTFLCLGTLIPKQ